MLWYLGHHSGSEFTGIIHTAKVIGASIFSLQLMQALPVKATGQGTRCLLTRVLTTRSASGIPIGIQRNLYKLGGRDDRSPLVLEQVLGNVRRGMIPAPDLEGRSIRRVRAT